MAEALSETGLPFDDIRRLVAALPGPDTASAAAVQARSRDVIVPQGSLGRIEEIVAWLAAWQASSRPMISRPLVAVFAASHGVAEHLSNTSIPHAARTRLDALAEGKCAVNQICTAHDIGLKVFDLAIEHPTPNIVESDALDEAACAATMAYGMEATAGGTDLLCVGDIAGGNDVIAAALCHALFGGSAEDWVGLPAGREAADQVRRVHLVRQAVERLSTRDPLEVLRRIGGREFAATAGAVLAARHQRIPVILDGFAATAAAAVLHTMAPNALAHCLAGHRAADPAHAHLLRHLGLSPLLDLGIALGEGTGAALAASLVKTALACWRDMTPDATPAEHSHHHAH